MKKNMKEWMDNLIRDKKVAAVPVMTHPGIELTGNTVLEACSNGDAHFKAIKALADKYPTAAASVIMDLTVEAEAFGSEISFTDNEVPAVIGHLLDSPEDIRNLKVPSLKAGRVPQYLKANLLAARYITDRPVIGGCIGPFSLAGRLYDMSEIMILIYQDPEAAHLLLAKCTEFILKYCKALKECGVNAVMMAEPAAGLMSDEDCRRFSSDYVKKIVDAVQDDFFSVILHNCGNTGHCTGAMVATGSAAYHFGNKCDMAEVSRDVPASALTMGNLDPVSVFKDSTPEQIYHDTTMLLEKMKEFPNFVLSSGCDTPPHTPMVNIDSFFKALYDFNNK
ncbi:MAG: uroporphyrinogen decarboxylase family protein [Duncaniella sp.]|nr:uroporphyrinogen decarboxylase family protein [Duncaniella sp.]MDE6466659.1 uroporphyrinogen decarboxylase family protein [Duncaniella sp.]